MREMLHELHILTAISHPCAWAADQPNSDFLVSLTCVADLNAATLRGRRALSHQRSDEHPGAKREEVEQTVAQERLPRYSVQIQEP